MPRINPLTTTDAPAKSQPLLEDIAKSMGGVPNILGTLAQAPAALQSYLGFSQALSGGDLSGALREQIALTVAAENSCGYCASAHTALGKMAGIDEAELARNLAGEASDPKTKAALDFARAIVSRRGLVADADLQSIRGAGFSDGEVVEIVAVVALNVFTNYFNHVADTEIDFPKVDVPQPALT